MAQDSKKETVLQSSTGHRPELAFPLLTEDMLSRIRGYGTEETIPAQTQLFASPAQRRSSSNTRILVSNTRTITK
jgi:hypothetical protein